MIDVGVGLYAMQSTAAAPAAWPALYAELQEDAQLAERLGLHSLWITEHRLWYDGWCPNPLVAAAAALGATRELRVGLGITVLPLVDPKRLAAAAAELHRLSQARLEVGVGLGYRVPEYDGLGLPREGAGTRMAHGLDELTAAWTEGGPAIWVGGIADVSIRRATARGLGLILPQTLRDPELEALIAAAREQAPATRVAVIRHAWPTDGSEEQRRQAEDRIVGSAREYAGAWWLLKGSPAFDEPDLLERQMRRNLDPALIGTAAEMAEQLREMERIGVDLAILQLATDRTHPENREAMRRLAEEALPQLRGAAG